MAEPVLEALKKRLEHPFFGYTFPGESVYQAVISYYKRRYDFDVKKNGSCLTMELIQEIILLPEL